MGYHSRPMRILDQYLLREIARSLLAVTIILLLTTVGLFLGDTLADVARGRVPAELLLSQLGLRSVEALSVLVPLSVFLGIMLSLGRLYRDSEMVVMSACGVSRAYPYRPLVRIVLPTMALLLVLGLWVSPWAQRTAKEMVADAAARVTVAGLQPGRFQPIAARDSVVYVESVDPDGVFHNAFLHIDRDGRKDIVTAREGFQYQDPDTGARYLALLDGLRSEGVPGQADFRMMRFERNDVRVPDPEEGQAGLKHGALPLAELLEDTGPAEWAELHWRLAPALALLALTALAVPLSHTRPREGYYGNLVLGVLVYIVYANLLALGRSWLDKGDLPPWVGLWWLPAIALVAAVLLIRPPRRQRRPRAAT